METNFTLILDKKQIVEVGIMIDAMLKGTGVQYIDTIYEIRRQIKEQLDQEKQLQLNGKK